MTDLPEHVSSNRARWDDAAEQYVAAGERGWASETPAWGIWSVPESDVGMLPDDLAGKDAIELGCGTAYVSAWLGRRGARVVGIDNSEAQLATARRLPQQHALDFPLLHGNAETVPFPDASFDFAISEYGASLWADPARWVPEAARLLRPDGLLVFLTNSFLLTLCMPAEDGVAATDRVLRPAFGIYRVQWPADPGRGIPPLARRLDPASSSLRVRGRGSGRGASSHTRNHPPSVRDARMGPPLAVRRSVEGAEAWRLNGDEAANPHHRRRR